MGNRPHRVVHWVVAAAEEGMTLLSFLRCKYPDASSVKALKRAIDGKYCTLNGQVETFSSHPLKQGMRVVLDLAAFAQDSPLPLGILYEDADLLICNKPAGMLSESRLFNQRLPAYKKHLELVHRLDRETSGAIILAKHAEIREQMFLLFKQRQVEKTYLALVDGKMARNAGEITQDLGLKKRYTGQSLYQVVRKGKEAHTAWVCLKKGKTASLLLCTPRTGRTHQLRVHLSAIGHPILGDTQYGAHFRCQLRPRRHLLHAYEISFVHPRTQKKVAVKAPIPEDFKQALRDV